MHPSLLQLHRANKHKCTTHNVHTDTHCQLIQRGDQSETPVQHTLRGRVVKQSTVCIIYTAAASHFSFSFFLSTHLCFPSARLAIIPSILWWMESCCFFLLVLLFQHSPSHRSIYALTYLDQSHCFLIHLPQQLTRRLCSWFIWHLWCILNNII